MQPPRTFSRIMLVFTLACLGLVLVYVPSWITQNYKAARDLGSVWATIYLLFVGTGGVLLLAASGWIGYRLWRSTVRKRRRRVRRAKNPSQLSPAEREAELKQNLSMVDTLQADANVSPDVRAELSPLVKQLEYKREKQRLEIVAFGTVSSGKSSLLNALAGRDVFATDMRGGTTLHRSEVPWPGLDQVILVDTPGLGEVDGELRQEIAAGAAEDADLILVVVDGPLRNSEFQLLQMLAQMEKRVLICLNKEDWYSAADRDALLDQVREQVGDMVDSRNVLAVRSRQATRYRKRVLPNGQESEEQVDVPPDIALLADRMLKIIKHDGRDLLMANLLLQSRGLIDEARDRVRTALDQRAWEIVDKYMWSSAGAAALSPLPVIDIAAGCAISSKMVIDLARVYKQDIDVDAAMGLLGQQTKTFIGVIGSSLATPAVSSGIASLIKTVPGVGTIAGGMLQGVVQAVVTRWIGAVFIRYFRDEMREPPGGLAALAREEWKKVTSVNELRKLVQAARQQLAGNDEQDDEAQEFKGD